MFEQIDKIITMIDEAVWGLPLICLIMMTGIFLTARLGLLQIRHLGKAFKFMVKNEDEGEGEVTSFGALCTALSATIGTGNIAGVATAIAAGGPGALFWMVLAAFFGMATKYAEGLLAIKYRTVDKDGSRRAVLLHRKRHGQKLAVAGKAVCVFWSMRGSVRYRYIYSGEQYRVSGQGLF